MSLTVKKTRRILLQNHVIQLYQGIIGPRMIDIEEEYIQSIELSSYTSNTDTSSHTLTAVSQTSLDPPFHSYVINHATLITEHDKKSQNLTMFYEPEKYITGMHAAPRFGHTNRLGKLASANRQEAQDYAGGLKQFTLFIVVPFIIWAIILVLFKFLYGIDKIGCAAGGEVLDLKDLSKQGLSRKKRKKRIIRGWRLQTAFMITGILVPTASLVMMQSGWQKLQLAWDEIKAVVDDVEAMAFRGWNVLDGLRQSKDTLEQNRLVHDLLRQSSSGESIFTSWCPNAQENQSLAFIHASMETLETSTESIITLFDTHVPHSSNGFIAVTQATQSVDESIVWFFQNDWIWKMYIMVVNVLVVFMVMCCYIFSKHNIIHVPTRFYLTFFIVPLFSIVTVCLILVTASSGVATLLNADFCAGGEEPGSPLGTIRDAILSYQHASLAPTENFTGTLTLVLETFNYYAEGCLTNHPLGFLDEYAAQVNEVASYIVDLNDNLSNRSTTVELLNEACGNDVSFLLDTLQDLEKDLLIVQSNMNKLVDIASCHSISPILRRMTRGAICKDSPNALTWIWATSLFICVCCFVLLTTRAALYNAIKKRKPREKKPKRVVEKEFQEYKEFMVEYYPDAADWKLEYPTSKANKVEIDFGSQIRPNPTFETAATDTFSDEDDFSEAAGINQLYAVHDSREDRYNKPRDESESRSSSSYNSDYESDSDASEDENSDEESALLSFIVETRSIISETKATASSFANRTMLQIKNIRPLLGRGQGGSEGSDEEESVHDSCLFLDQHHSPAKSLKLPEDGDGVWNEYRTPPSTSYITGPKTPQAPLKPFSFFGRTTEAPEYETVPLTRIPWKPNTQNPRIDNDVHPRRLTMSPRKDLTSSSSVQPSRRFNSKRSSLLDSGVTESLRHRPYLDVNDSDDTSLYVEDIPTHSVRVSRPESGKTHGDRDRQASRGKSHRNVSNQKQHNYR